MDPLLFAIQEAPRSQLGSPSLSCYLGCSLGDLRVGGGSMSGRHPGLGAPPNTFIQPLCEQLEKAQAEA